MNKIYLLSGLLFFVVHAVNAQFLIGTINPNCSGECNGEAQITNQVTSNYHYKWSTGSTSYYITNLCPGVYSCTVSDLLGVAIDTFSVILFAPIPDGYEIIPSNVSCQGASNGSIEVEAVVYLLAPYKFAIGKNDSDFNLSNSGMFTGLDTGFYTILTIDANGCTDTFDIYISQSDTPCTTQINDIAESFNCTVWPNPATKKLNITLNTVLPNTTLQITSTDGRTITQPIPIQQSHFELDISTLAAGIYFITLQNENGRVVRRFIKE